MYSARGVLSSFRRCRSSPQWTTRHARPCKRGFLHWTSLCTPRSAALGPRECPGLKVWNPMVLLSESDVISCEGREQKLNALHFNLQHRKIWRLYPSSPMLNPNSKAIICLLSFLISLPLAWIAISHTTRQSLYTDTLPRHHPRTPPHRSAHKRADSMSKLSPTLKALINAPFARPDQTAASARILDVYKTIAGDAQKRSLGLKPWLALSVGFISTRLSVSLPR